MLDGEPGTQVRAAAGSRSEGHTGWAAPCLVVRPSHLAPSCPRLAPGAQHPPPERAPCAHHSPHHRGAPPWLEFGVCDGTVDKEHSPRGEAARAQLFLSVCGPPGSWSVYTKLQASRENLQPYHGILATLGLGRWGGMCVSLAPFPKETSGFM